MALSTIPTRALSEQGINFRNLIINGDMSIAQRGTSASSITSSGYHTVDRWRPTIGSLGTWTISQSTDVPTGQGFGYSQKFDCTTADAAPSAGDLFQLNQRIEGQNLQLLKKGTSNAESTTLSFWVKSNKTGTYIVGLSDVDNSRNIFKSYTINSANTWEKKTLTFAGDTTGTLDNNNARSLDVRWWLGAGSDYTSGTLATSWESETNANTAVGQVNLADSTSNEWYITGVQLEVGTSASDFEFLPHDVNFQRTQRYCQKYTDPHMAGVNQGTPGRTGFNLATFMRSSPSVTVSGTFGFYDGGGTQNYTTANTTWSNPNSFQIDWGGTSFSVQGKANIQYLASGSNYILLDAEL